MAAYGIDYIFRCGPMIHVRSVVENIGAFEIERKHPYIFSKTYGEIPGGAIVPIAFVGAAVQ